MPFVHTMRSCAVHVNLHRSHRHDTHVRFCAQVTTRTAAYTDKAATLPAGPPLCLRWETDIFEALGLAYVPPHMREGVCGG